MKIFYCFCLSGGREEDRWLFFIRDIYFQSITLLTEMDTDLVKPLPSLLTTLQPQGLYFLSGFFIAISGTQQKYKVTVTTYRHTHWHQVASWEKQWADYFGSATNSLRGPSLQTPYGNAGNRSYSEGHLATQHTSAKHTVGLTVTKAFPIPACVSSLFKKI